MFKKFIAAAMLLFICSELMAQSIANGRYSIISRHSGLGLDVEAGSTADGANIQQWNYNSGTHQQFDVTNLGNGYYSIRPAHSGKSLDVFNFSLEPGGEIRQWTYWGGETQQWAITSVGSGYYTITSLLSGLNLDVWEWSTASGGDIRQWSATGGYNQHWAFNPVGATSTPTPAPVPTPSNNVVGFATQNGGTTGGQGGQTVTVSNYTDLKSYAESSSTYTIYVQGTISNGSGGGQIRVASNKSIIGVGSNALLSGVGIEISNSNNIILQNLRMTLVGTTTPSSVNGGDIVSIRGTSKNIWVDHCELFSENPDVQTDINKYDGLIDIRDQTGFITLSWNYFHDHHKGGLVGAADTDLYADRKVTFHHNYYNKVKLRVPMYRGSTGHFFNNYIVGATDATEIRAGTCVRVEKNYYEALHYSIYTPSDSPGSTQRIDNIEVSRTSRAYPSNCTASIPYSYSSVLTNTTADVKTVVPANAGVGKI